MYGTHPFYMNVERSGKAHGVLFLNSNAQGHLSSLKFEYQTGTVRYVIAVMKCWQLTGCVITNPRAAQRLFRVRVRVGVVFSLGLVVSVRVVRFE